MSTVMGTGGFAPLLKPGLHDVFIETGEERPKEYDKVFNVDDMDWNPMTDQQIAGLGTLQSKPQGSGFRLDRMLLGGSKVWEATPYGLAIEFTFEMWRDELYGVAREMVKELARAGRHREEIDAWSILNNAFSTSFVGFTSGEALCSTSHSLVGGGTLANRPTPDVAFGVTGIQNAIIRFENMTNHRGLPRLMSPSRVVVAPRNRFAAREILGSSSVPYKADNEINALIEDDLSWMVSHYLTTATNWFVLAAKGVHSMWFLWRDHPIFDGFDDPRTKNAIFTLYQRHAAGFNAWEGVDGSNA